MDKLSVFFYSVAIAQMLFCALLLLPRTQKSLASIFYIVLMLAGSAYLLGEMYQYQSDNLGYWFAFLGGNLLPGVFWLLSLTLFSDHITIRLNHYGVASLALIIPIVGKLLDWNLGLSINTLANIKMVAMLIELALISHAVIIAMRNWQDDLIQQRRYMRAALIGLTGVYLLLVIIVEQALHVNAEWLTQVESILLALLALTINYWLLQLRTDGIFYDATDAKAQSEQANSSPDIKRIVSAMESELLYQQEGITITELAKTLVMHEYKLRHLINGELGYRNFNDFLNYYRIKEVSEKLLHPDYASTAILNLALDSGFRSLSSFNKAFKETHQLTPTEFKKQHLR